MLAKILECFFCWHVSYGTNLSYTPNVIIGLSFGSRKNGSGISNAKMAEISLALIRGCQGLIAQHEIADELPKDIQNLWVINESREKGKYLDTFEVLLQAGKIMHDHGWKTALIICHPWHAWRIKKVLEKMGIEAIFPYGIMYVTFDHQSTQWWTRNKFLWILREIPARLIYLARRWI